MAPNLQLLVQLLFVYIRNRNNAAFNAQPQKANLVLLDFNKSTLEITL